MKQAFHMVGIPSSDFFRLRDRAVTEADLIRKAEQRYQQIQQQGTLLAHSIQEQCPDKETSRLFALDHLVGDATYIYLSVGRRYWNDPESTNFGFFFDAEQLVRECGAIVRVGDFLTHYEEILDDIASKFYPDQGFTEEDLKLLEKALDNPDLPYTSPHELYRELCDAIEHRDLAVPHAQEGTALFHQKVQDFWAKHQFTGEAALQYLQKTAGDGTLELLVKEQLPLSFCRGTIQRGIIIS